MQLEPPGSTQWLSDTPGGPSQDNLTRHCQCVCSK